VLARRVLWDYYGQGVWAVETPLLEQGVYRDLGFGGERTHERGHIGIRCKAG